MRLLATLLIVAALSGCIGTEPAAVEPALEPEHPLARSSFTWEPEVPLVGEPVNFDPQVRSGVQDNELERIIWDFGPVEYVENQPTYTFDTPGEHIVSARIDTTKASDWIVSNTIWVAAKEGEEPPPKQPQQSRPADEEPEAQPEPEPEPVGFNCAGESVIEATPTHGKDGTAMWAVLKTGFRFVIAFEGSQTLTYIHTGQEQSVEGTSVIFLDDLKEGRDLCFRLGGGPWHAVHLGNAMNGYDDAAGVYTVNFAVLTSEYTRANILEKAIQEFAERMVDATDGNIRVGNIIVVDHLEREQEALQICWNANAGRHVSTFETVFCDRWYDMIFSHNVNPLAAGATYKDGIQDPNVPVWMNAVHEAGIASQIFTEESQVKEVAGVLTHEVGHYMIGAQDLYPEGGIVTNNCYQASTDISVMSSSRDAREFDGQDAPCPTANGDYKPTWQEMTKRFPLIPERVGGTVPGPYHDGGAFGFGTYSV